MAQHVVVRRAQPSDAAALKTFRCSSGAEYEQEVERLIRRRLSKAVAKGFANHGFSVWVVDRDGELVAVAAHVGHQHPDGSGTIISWLMVLAARIDGDDQQIVTAASLGRLLRGVILEGQEAGRSPYWYAIVANENEKMGRFCERMGFSSGPMPSNENYRFYTCRFVPKAASASVSP